jgi:signal transduction histidine kinase
MGGAADRSARGLAAPLLRIGSGRIIATARLATAGLALVAIWLDPTQPALYAGLAYALLLFYLFYAASLLLVIAGPGRRRDAADGPIAHAIDVAVILAMVFFTCGTTSPFFVFFNFLLLAGYLRWGWRGSVATAVPLLIGYAGVSYLSVAGISYRQGELDDFIVRLAYLAIAAAIIAYIGRGQEAMRNRLARLANWPAGGQESEAVGQCLAHAADCLGIDRLALVWLEKQGGRAGIHLWNGARAETRRKSRRWAEFVMPEDNEGGDLLYREAEARPRLTRRRPGASDRVARRKLSRLFRARSVLGVRIRTETGHGWLFAADARPRMGIEDEAVCHLVVARIGALMDDLDLHRRMREQAAREKTAELARDLHDGILQTLAGATLHLHDLRRLIRTQPERAGPKLDMVMELLAEEQRELRAVIGQLQPHRPRLPGATVPLGPQLERLVSRLAKQWRVEISCELQPRDAELPIRLSNQVRRIVSEALANAKRHSQANKAWLTVEIGQRDISLSIANDRPKRGEAPVPALLSAEALRRPKMLSERVAALGGNSDIQSSEDRVEVTVQLPRRT